MRLTLTFVTAECLGDASGAYAKGTGGGAQTC
jgi:hypothetical protein